MSEDAQRHDVLIGSARPVEPFGDRPRVGVALGAGAARGFAHAGVLEVLLREGIPIDLIVGISIGAFVGAIWAYEQRAEEMIERFGAFLDSPQAARSILAFPTRNEEDDRGNFFRRIGGTLRQKYTYSKAMVGRSMLPHEYLNTILRALVPDRDIAETKIPFACVAVDVMEARRVLFTAGPVRSALLASAAIPGVFPPVELGKRLLIDGATMGGIPVDACRSLGADLVIGCDVRASIRRPFQLESGIDLTIRADAITGYELSQAQLERTDVAIQPQVGHLFWADFHQYREAYDAGVEAARRSLPELRRAIADWSLEQRRARGWWERLRGFTGAGATPRSAARR